MVARHGYRVAQCSTYCIGVTKAKGWAELTGHRVSHLFKLAKLVFAGTTSWVENFWQFNWGGSLVFNLSYATANIDHWWTVKYAWKPGVLAKLCHSILFYLEKASVPESGPEPLHCILATFLIICCLVFRGVVRWSVVLPVLSFWDWKPMNVNGRDCMMYFDASVCSWSFCAWSFLICGRSSILLPKTHPARFLIQLCSASPQEAYQKLYIVSMLSIESSHWEVDSSIHRAEKVSDVFGLIQLAFCSRCHFEEFPCSPGWKKKRRRRRRKRRRTKRKRKKRRTKMKRKKRKRKRHVTIRSFIWEVSAGQNGSTTVELQYGRKRRKAEGWTCGLQQHPIPLPTNTEVPRHARTPRTTCFWHVFVRKPGSNFHQENSADCVLVEAPQDKREKELAKEKEAKKVGLCYTPCGSLRCFFTLYHEHQCEHLVRQDAETKNLIQVSDVIDQQLKKKKEATVSPYISDLNVNCVNCKTCCSDGRCIDACSASPTQAGEERRSQAVLHVGPMPPEQSLSRVSQTLLSQWILRKGFWSRKSIWNILEFESGYS